MRLTAWVFSTWRCTSAANAGLRRSCTAQATVEAAVLVPVFLTVLLLSLQPACMLYTRTVMESAAAETARVAALWEGAPDDEAVVAFAQRRLAAVPDLAIFHEGGPLAWDIDVERTEKTVAVSVSGALRPLPVIGAFARFGGNTDAYGNLRLSARTEIAYRPEWVEGGYDDWIALWS